MAESCLNALPWGLRRTPVRPADLETSGCVVVPEGARLSGKTAGALVRICAHEHRRRQAASLGALTDLALLDVLMNMPIGEALPRSVLSPDEQDVLNRAPRGVVELRGPSIVRIADRPVEVDAVIASGSSWRQLVRGLAAFGGVAQRIAVLDTEPLDVRDLMWEAEATGVGVWLSRADGPIEVLAPEVFTPTYVKPARWRFQEYAYRELFKSTSQPAWWNAPSGRRSHTGFGECDQPEVTTLQFG